MKTKLQNEIFAYEIRKSNTLFLIALIIIIGTVIALEVYNTVNAEQFIQLKSMNQ